MSMFNITTISHIENTPRFLFVSACREDNKEIPFVKCLKKMSITEFSVDVSIVYGNTDGLPVVYNRFLNDEQIKDYDYVILLHDDIWLNDVLVFDKIVGVSSFYDIIGVCGGKEWRATMDLNTPISWTSATKSAGGSGFMLHCLKNENTEEKYENMNYFSSNYGKSPSKTMTLDGCFGSSANCRKPFCPAATHPNTAGHFGKPRCRVGTPPLPGCIRRSALHPIIP